MSRSDVIRDIAAEFYSEHTQKGIVTSAMLIDALEGPMNAKQAGEYLNRAMGTIENRVSIMDIPHHKRMRTEFSRAEIWEWIFQSEYGMNLKKAS